VRRTNVQIAQLVAQQKEVYATYIRTHPTSPFGLYALGIFGDYQSDVATYAPLFQALAPSVRNSPEGQKIQQQIARLQRTAIGLLAPDFSLPDPSGKLVKLADLRGQYVLVDFWASWCVPCRAENPNVVKTYAAYRDKNFTVVSISIDNPSTRAAWLKAIEQDGLTWPQVSCTDEIYEKYAISAIPQSFLIDPQGHIVAKNLKGDALPKKLVQLLATK
jgi:peroxiredoxin